MAFSPDRANKKNKSSRQVDLKLNWLLDAGKSPPKSKHLAQKEKEELKGWTVSKLAQIQMLGPVIRHVIQNNSDEESQINDLNKRFEFSQNWANWMAQQIGCQESEKIFKFLVLTSFSSSTSPEECFTQSFSEKIVALLNEKEEELNQWLSAKSSTQDLANKKENNNNLVYYELKLKQEWFSFAGRLLRLQQKFDFFRSNPEQDIMDAFNKIWLQVKEGTQGIVKQQMSVEEKGEILLSLFQQLVENMLYAWEFESKRIQVMLKQKTKSDIQAWRKANPKGMSLNSLWNRFNEASRRLVLLVQHLSLSV